jgi:tRNA uridine 5-carboxymethylaminomethyl modification enzyme
VIPAAFQYRGIPGLSREAVERLTAVRPVTLGQASRVSGITPAAVAIVGARIERLQREHGVATGARSRKPQQ